MAIRVSYEGATRKMRAVGNVLKRPLRDVLDSGARTCAISLTKSTQPDGTGQEAKTQGEEAVARDIHHVYGNAGGAYERINSKLKGAFWAHYRKGDFNKAEKVANDSGVRVGAFDGGAAHKALRRTRRPVILRTQKPSIYIINPSERQKLERYIQFHQREVGTAKAGWVDCVRALGGTPRGLKQDNDITANWITRKSRGGIGTAVRGGTDQDPSVRITNRIPYVDQMLSQSAKRYAEQIARARMIKNLEYSVKTEMSKLRAA